MGYFRALFPRNWIDHLMNSAFIFDNVFQENQCYYCFVNILSCTREKIIFVRADNVGGIVVFNCKNVTKHFRFSPGSYFPHISSAAGELPRVLVLCHSILSLPADRDLLLQGNPVVNLSAVTPKGVRLTADISRVSHH